MGTRARWIGVGCLALWMVLGGIVPGSAAEIQPRLEWRIVPRKGHVGGTLELIGRMSWPRKYGEELVISEVHKPSNDLLQFADWRESTASVVTSSGVRFEKQFHYVFKAVKPGKGTLGPVNVEYAEKSHPADKYLAKGEAVSFEVIPAWLYSLGVALRLGGALLGAWILFLAGARLCGMMGIAGKGAGRPAAPDPSLWEKLLPVRTARSEGDVKKYYAKLEDILSQEAGVQSGVAPRELESLLEEVKKMGEKVRFGGYRPTDKEQDRLLKAAEKYFLTRGRST